MSMQIQGLPGGLVQNAGESLGSSPTPDQGGSRPTATEAPRADTLSLTDSAARLRGLEARMADQPVVDSQRVESTQRLLATGSFQVNPVSTSDKIMEMERNLP